MGRKGKAAVGLGLGVAAVPLAVGGFAPPAGAYVDSYLCIIFHHEGQPGGTRASGTAGIGGISGGERDAYSNTNFHWNNAPSACSASSGFHAVVGHDHYKWTAGGFVECDANSGEGYNGLAVANTTCSTSGTGGFLHLTMNTHKIWNQGTAKIRGPYCVTTDTQGYGC